MIDQRQAVFEPQAPNFGEPVPASRTLYQNLALLLCVLFGILLIAQVQVGGDGTWYWYAVLLNSGKHLYSGLHLPLQPLYPLMNAWSLKVFGPGWIASKVPAVLFVVIFAGLLRGIVRFFPGSDLQRGVAMLMAFSMPLLFEASRFDDYHVIADSLLAASVLLLIARARAVSGGTSAGIAAALGVLAGLDIVCRLNDGAFLAMTVFVVLFFVARDRRWSSLLLFCAAAAFCAVAVIALSGDSIADWANYSIFRAAGAKGGTGTVLLYPVKLLGDVFRLWGKNQGYAIFEMYTAAVASLVVLLARRRRNGESILLPAGGLLVLAALFLPMRKHWGWEELPISIQAPAMVLAFVLGVVALAGALRNLLAGKQGDGVAAWNPLQLLVLLPLGQIFSGSMSSAGTFLPLTSPAGILLLVAPIGFPQLVRLPSRRIAYATVLGAMAFCCFGYKWQKPFHWHTYSTAPLFVGREVYHHPIYGPMIIETKLLNFVEPICREEAGAPSGLLSLPYPYANYFCGVPPWHGYVQTFFDTSTEQTILQMIGELQSAPPGLIVYQRQIKNLESHEELYNHGKPLPHRKLDEFLGDRLNSGQWTAIEQQCLGPADWILIRTAPASALGGRTLPKLEWTPYRCDKNR